MKKPAAKPKPESNSNSNSKQAARPNSKLNPPAPASDTALAVSEALEWLKDSASTEVKAGMARYAIPSDKALGVAVGTIQNFAKSIGRDQALSEALWATDIYEARHLAIFLGDPAQVTPAQMDRWCADFDNWALCDAACFQLFDRVPQAFLKVGVWAREQGEFQKRAAFALLASLALHDKNAPDTEFLASLPLIEAASDDDRNFVKKAVNWALRSISSRNPALRAAAMKVSQSLADSKLPSARWIGKDARRQLQTPASLKRAGVK